MLFDFKPLNHLSSKHRYANIRPTHSFHFNAPPTKSHSRNRVTNTPPFYRSYMYYTNVSPTTSFYHCWPPHLPLPLHATTSPRKLSRPDDSPTTPRDSLCPHILWVWYVEIVVKSILLLAQFFIHMNVLYRNANCELIYNTFLSCAFETRQHHECNKTYILTNIYYFFSLFIFFTLN